MSYKNFVPTVWAAAIQRELERKAVFLEDCNRQYEGDVKKMGDTVRILGVGRPTITTQQGGTINLESPEDVEDTSATMLIDTVSYFNYKVDDIDRRQAQGKVLEALNEEASEGLANEMDQNVANQAQDAAAARLEKTVQQLDKTNVLNYIDAMLLRLYENDVKPNSNIVMNVPPWLWGLIKKAYVELDTDNSKMVKTGSVGMYGGAIIKMSNNCAKGEGGAHYPMMRTPRAIGFANPRTHTEPFRPESGFSDAVKGYVLYGSKIVRPKELIVLPCKPKLAE